MIGSKLVLLVLLISLYKFFFKSSYTVKPFDAEFPPPTLRETNKFLRNTSLASLFSDLIISIISIYVAKLNSLKLSLFFKQNI